MPRKSRRVARLPDAEHDDQAGHENGVQHERHEFAAAAVLPAPVCLRRDRTRPRPLLARSASTSCARPLDVRLLLRAELFRSWRQPRWDVCEVAAGESLSPSDSRPRPFIDASICSALERTRSAVERPSASAHSRCAKLHWRLESAPATAIMICSRKTGSRRLSTSVARDRPRG